MPTKREPQLSLDAFAGPTPSCLVGEDVADVVAGAEQLDRLRTAMAVLTPAEQNILRTLTGEASIGKVAVELGCSERNVSRRKLALRLRLARLLSEGRP